MDKWPDLVVVLQQLNDDLDIVMVVLDRDDTQDVGCILSIWVLAVLVGEYQTRIGLLDLQGNQRQISHSLSLR